MAALENIADEEFVQFLVRTGRTHEEIAQYYQNLYPLHRGLSARSIRRYCLSRNITRITDEELNEVVRHFVNNYGHTYGRRMMLGSVRSMIGITSSAVVKEELLGHCSMLHLKNTS